MALDGDAVDGGLIVARVVGGQLDEPDEKVADLHRRGGAATARCRPRSRALATRGSQAGSGLASGAQLDAGAGAAAQGQAHGGDRDRPAHVEEQAGSASSALRTWGWRTTGCTRGGPRSRRPRTRRFCGLSPSARQAGPNAATLAGARACTATGVTEGGGEVGAWDALTVLVLVWAELPWTAGALAGGLVRPPAGEGPWLAAVACGLAPTPEANKPAKRTAKQYGGRRGRLVQGDCSSRPSRPPWLESQASCCRIALPWPGEKSSYAKRGGAHVTGRPLLFGRSSARVVNGSRAVARRSSGTFDSALDSRRSLLGRVGAPEQRWAWGRDEENRFWIAFGPHTAVRMDSNEVPYGISVHCDLHVLNVENLLSDLLNRFDVNRETKEGDADPSTIRIHATARYLGQQKSPNPIIQTVDLEINAETRVVRRMVVHRVAGGLPFATVTFTLSETDSLDPDDYLLEGHLMEPFEIYTRDHLPQRRKELLARWFGSRSERWIRSLESAK